MSIQEIYDFLKARQPDAMVMFNQHIGDGSTIYYFPTDALNGEVTLPPQGGHEPWREVDGDTWYLPFELDVFSQVRSGDGAYIWFPVSTGAYSTESLRADEMYPDIKKNFDRDATNVLVAVGPDETGRFRQEDLAQFELLGHLVWGDADREAEPHAVVDHEASLGTTRRNDTDDRVGMRVTVGSSDLVVTGIGRFHVTGNSGLHSLSLTETDGTILGSVEVDMSTDNPDASDFVYGALPTPVTLSAGTAYNVSSQESAGGDLFYGGGSDFP